MQIRPVPARSVGFTDLGIPFTAQELTYRLRQVDLDGTASYSDQRTVMIGAPVTLQLDAPYPNPVRGMATVNYQLPAAGDVTIAVYDLLGRKVMTLQDGAQEMGRKSIQMNTQQLASGTYFLRLQTDEDVLTQRLTVVR
ncbi:MAG: T9SS type A sorting domain-containing protein [Longimonas sp.]|uniref:T9SS type A sorting domain-containing protein n=1 Tax=Longimonas sp. TaxID=2039626 RepID=UPI0039757997